MNTLNQILLLFILGFVFFAAFIEPKSTPKPTAKPAPTSAPKLPTAIPTAAPTAAPAVKWATIPQEILGASNTPLPDNGDDGAAYVGTDGKTKCKACQIDCNSTSILTDCQYRYYIYGCRFASKCVSLSSASPFQVETALAFCVFYAGCKLTASSRNETSFALQATQSAPASKVVDVSQLVDQYPTTTVINMGKDMLIKNMGLQQDALFYFKTIQDIRDWQQGKILPSTSLDSFSKLLEPMWYRSDIPQWFRDRFSVPLRLGDTPVTSKNPNIIRDPTKLWDYVSKNGLMIETYMKAVNDYSTNHYLIMYFYSYCRSSLDSYINSLKSMKSKGGSTSSYQDVQRAKMFSQIIYEYVSTGKLAALNVDYSITRETSNLPTMSAQFKVEYTTFLINYLNIYWPPIMQTQGTDYAWDIRDCLDYNAYFAKYQQQLYNVANSVIESLDVVTSRAITYVGIDWQRNKPYIKSGVAPSYFLPSVNDYKNIMIKIIKNLISASPAFGTCVKNSRFQFKALVFEQKMK